MIRLPRPLDPVRSIKIKIGMNLIGAGAAGVTWFYLWLGWFPVWTAVTAMVVALVTLQFLAHGMTSPLREMTAAARSMAQGDYTRRVRATSRDEVGQLADAFNQMAADLAAADRQRRELIANVSHELRTPLTSIGSYIDLIAESPDDTPFGDLRELFEVVQRNNARLRDLVERLLDLSALESGHAAMATEPVDLAEVVNGAIAATVTERGIVVDPVQIDPVTVRGDRDRLRQVVDNLLSNAVKFSPPAGTVSVTLAGEGGVASLTVADHGVGVPATEQARLFRRLYRAGNVRHTGIPGAGLGLALCRVVVERHHGTITLASHESTGTTVTVRLPK